MDRPVRHFEAARSRRDFLCRAGGGFGALALWSLLGRDTWASGDEIAAALKNPLAAKPPQFPAKAKSVIWCFLDGGPSHLDLFDPEAGTHEARRPAAARQFHAADDGDGQDGLHAALGRPANVQASTANRAFGSAIGIPRSPRASTTWP